MWGLHGEKDGEQLGSCGGKGVREGVDGEKVGRC